MSGDSTYNGSSSCLQAITDESNNIIYYLAFNAVWSYIKYEEEFDAEIYIQVLFILPEEI